MTDPDAVQRLQQARELELTEQIEVVWYKKNRK